MPCPIAEVRISCSKGVASGSTGSWGERAWLRSDQQPRDNMLYEYTADQQPRDTMLYEYTADQQPRDNMLYEYTTDQQPRDNRLYEYTADQQPRDNMLHEYTANQLSHDSLCTLLISNILRLLIRNHMATKHCW